MPYVELHACSAFSFLRGGSFPEQLAETAAGLKMPAMALLDRNGVYGAQRFSVAAREHNVRPIVGAELTMVDGSVLPVLVKDRGGYANLCGLLTQGHLRSAKGECAFQWSELPEFAEGLIALSGRVGVPPAGFGVSPKRSFKSSRKRDAFAGGRDAHPTRESPLPPMTMPERVKADYDAMNLTTGPHPMKLLRTQLPHVWRASDLPAARHGATIQIAGNVICRQRPGTAKGFVFVSLEDETGVSNAIVTPDLFERMRLLITEEPFLLIEGKVQNTENVVLIKAEKIRPLAHEQLVGSESHDFR